VHLLFALSRDKGLQGSTQSLGRHEPREPQAWHQTVTQVSQSIRYRHGLDEKIHVQLLNEISGSPVSTPAEAKVGAMEHVEQVHTNERVPGHPNYYEKDGLRTQGDGIDHEAEPKMTFARMMSLIAMAFCE
jgi:hypothetical protein